MANIKAFKALHPNGSRINNRFIEHAEVGLGEEMLEIKRMLVPKKGSSLVLGTIQTYDDNLNELIDSGLYHQEKEPAIYIYELQINQGRQYGVWVMTDIQDLLNGAMITHENTLADREARLHEYRKDIGLEGSPVLLTYRPQAEINVLIEQIVKSREAEIFSIGGIAHRLWKVNEVNFILKFKNAFQKVNRVYVADGHHRLAAAEELHKVKPQWITALYVSSDQIKISEFNRVVIPEKKVSKSELFSAIETYFYISPIPGNVPFRPNKQHCFGVCFDGVWYQLDLKEDKAMLKQETDVAILQHKILQPLFGIDNPATNPCLHSFPTNRWEEMLTEAKNNPTAVVFSLYPMSVDQLIGQVEKHVTLPPKSTFIEPKIPFGLLLYSHKLDEE
ncbi:DUF1015 domain-containing protein [Pedobacter punctiformis]|uniref:DUF1015 domain-containing protein n=1 Tax=Pedobacter punctiformis TaxID=3004097 RepID=A0ABT4L535_9SPHI|nr:DUF1015 domain-containing protein [Pedobacter sp. HCMS5-2]MCZ4243030.1 DUF1015 domain-containing protein [Pedobacter sp. HCMS5-2]